ncbi:MAG: FHA domain-containing protein [Verrucomicrobiota bacterium]
MAILFVAHEGGAVIRHPLRKHLTTIGRDSRNDVVIDDPHISAFHAQIHYNPFLDNYLVVDLGSHNGTRINGRRVMRGTVSESDTLILGNREVRVLSTFKEKVPFLNLTEDRVETDEPAAPVAFQHRMAAHLVQHLAPELDNLEMETSAEDTLQSVREDLLDLLEEVSVQTISFQKGTRTHEILDRANFIPTRSGSPARFVLETVKPGYVYSPETADDGDSVVLRKALVRPDGPTESA